MELPLWIVAAAVQVTQSGFQTMTELVDRTAQALAAELAVAP